jgi:sulfate transport system permease protein
VFRRRTSIPGFGLTLGVTLAALCLVVLIPLSAVAFKAAGMTPDQFAALAFSERAVDSYKLSFTASFIGAAINGVFGLLTSWALVRYRFTGKSLLNAIVDLPFVVRSIEPVLRDLSIDVEEASATLGAGRLQTLWRVVLPSLGPAWLSGFALAFARGVGEYGSVIFIAGNKPYLSEIAPLLITIRLQQFDMEGASAIAVVMLAVSFVMLLVINGVQAWSRRMP